MMVWNKAEAMERIGDDEELLIELVDLLLSDVPGRMTRLRKATTRDEIRREAHGIKGAVANLGGDAAAAAMFALERAGAEGRVDDFPALCSTAEAAWATLEGTLKAWRSR